MLELRTGKGCIGEIEEHLDKRQPTLAAIRTQFFDELLERNVLMGIGIKGQVAHVLKQLAK